MLLFDIRCIPFGYRSRHNWQSLHKISPLCNHRRVGQVNFDMKRQKMARMGGKKIQKGLRFNPRTLAQIYLYSKRRGMAQNAFVQEAIRQLVEAEARATGIDWAPFMEFPTTPGFLECMMFDTPGSFEFNEEEEDRRAFVKNHREFFYLPDGKPNTINLRYLWPQIARYQELWSLGNNAHAAADAMTKDLQAVGIPAPRRGAPRDEGHGQRAAQNP